MEVLNYPAKAYSVLHWTGEMETRIVADDTPQELNRISGKCIGRKYLNKKGKETAISSIVSVLGWGWRKVEEG